MFNEKVLKFKNSLSKMLGNHISEKCLCTVPLF